jgi:hypothetical protein
MFVTKASGETEEFSEEKFRASLERVNVAPEIAGEIARQITLELKPGIRTSDIYRRAFGLLRRYNRLSAGRYALKRAMLELGPSGYPFENLVAAMFAAEGFGVKVDAVVSGKCVTHEIDVIAEKNGRQFVIECKYHNQPGIRSDVKVALYAWARFLDLGKFDEAWLVTNTKFTDDATRYAECVGMRVIGWNYPPEDSLEKRIDRLGLHPLTCLTSLSRSHKHRLLEKGLVLARDLEQNSDYLAMAGLGDDKIELVLKEARLLSNFS